MVDLRSQRRLCRLTTMFFLRQYWAWVSMQEHGIHITGRKINNILVLISIISLQTSCYRSHIFRSCLTPFLSRTLTLVSDGASRIDAMLNKNVNKERKQQHSAAAFIDITSWQLRTALSLPTFVGVLAATVAVPLRLQFLHLTHSSLQTLWRSVC